MPVETVPTDKESVALTTRVEEANALMREGYERLPFTDQPVGCVQWIHIDQVQANDYNPNAVAHQEMQLLYTSIEQDGYTQPVVAMWDDEVGKYVIVDGFHRWTVMRKYADIFKRTHGFLPVVVLDKTVSDRMASTIRHNRARGKHSVAGMGNLVFQMLMSGESDTTIVRKLGMEPEELARLKHITGYSKLYASVKEHSPPVLTSAQLKAKATYAKEHPDEHVPNDF